MQKSIKIFYYLVIFFLTLNGVNASNTIPDEWYQVIHTDRDGTNIIKNPENFLLTNAGPANEYYEFIDLLKKPLTGQYVACRFPARYITVKKTISLPQYDLSKCNELSQFVSSFHKKNISLVLSSEYFNAPSSMFGHIMIAFHNDDTPEISSDIVHFSAIVSNNEGPLTYIHSGLTGEYNGEYIREPLFKKIHEYNRVEQRYIYFYKLNMSQEQIDHIIYHLFELRGIKFKYYFLGKNCAFQIENLINIVTSQRDSNNYVYTLPIEIVYQFKDKIIQTSFIEPDIIRSIKLLKNLSKEDETALNRYIKNQDLTHNDFNSSSNQLKEGLYHYNNYKFRGERNPHIQHQLISNLTFTKSNLFADSLNPIDRQYPRKVQFSVFNHGNDLNTFELTFRPVLIDLYDFQYPNIHESELNLGEIKISGHKENTRIEELKIIKLSSISSINKLLKDLSWEGYIGLNRLNNNNELFMETKVGFGYTYSFSKHLSLTGLAKTGFEFNHSQNRPYAAPDISMFGYFLRNWKYRISYLYKFYNNERYTLLTSVFAFKLNQSVSFQAEIRNNFRLDDQSVGLSTLYYF